MNDLYFAACTGSDEVHVHKIIKMVISQNDQSEVKKANVKK